MTPSSLSAAPSSIIPNVVGGRAQASPSSRRLSLKSPITGEPLGDLPLSTRADLDAAVQAAAAAQQKWGRLPVKDRVQVMYRYKALLEENLDGFAEIISSENGKTHDEARAEIARGIECVEYACGLPSLIAGQVLEVSRGVECRTVRSPLGVVAGITPFNFPAMVAMWMYPLALSCGNAFILKPSEQTPLSAVETARLLAEAGLPEGLFSVVHGDREAVEAICDHPQIRAVGFVGSSKVAKLVYERCAQAGKRVRALGGAKNHLIVLPDADPEMTASNIVASFTGCAGQRCMAASVAIFVGKESEAILNRVRELAAQMVPGKNLGAVISPAAKERIEGYISRAEQSGTKLLLDGRGAKVDGKKAGGNYVGPTILDGCEPSHECACDEIFGPTLTVLRAKTLDEALAIENANPYGNAAALYTSSGEAAQYFAERASAGMIGVNIGVPVPRDPFAFGGWNQSAYGDGDITGLQAMDFWTATKKVTTKWSDKHRSNWMS